MTPLNTKRRLATLKSYRYCSCYAHSSLGAGNNDARFEEPRRAEAKVPVLTANSDPMPTLRQVKNKLYERLDTCRVSGKIASIATGGRRRGEYEEW